MLGGQLCDVWGEKTLDIKPGDEVLIKLDDGEIRILPSKNVVRRAQELVLQYIPSDRKLVDELIKDRRKEAAYE